MIRVRQKDGNLMVENVWAYNKGGLSRWGVKVSEVKCIAKVISFYSKTFCAKCIALYGTCVTVTVAFIQTGTDRTV